MNSVILSGIGLYHPKNSISNHELIDSFNRYVDFYNEKHADKIAASELTALQHSDVAFIEKASGIKSRYVVDKEGVLDIHCMQPRIAKRTDDELSIQAEMCVQAAEQALAQANKSASDIDMVIVACSNFQRAYPAISIEVQSAMGIEGFAYDMNVACSSATFAIFNAFQAIKNGGVKTALLLSPEVCSAHLNFCDRDSHFIFGDACTAIVLEEKECVTQQTDIYEVIDTRTKTAFSNNIRNNFGFLSCAEPEVLEDPRCIFARDKLFVQKGRRVFKDVIPMVSSLILNHLRDFNIKPNELQRLWLHQANAHMNMLIAEKVLGHKPDNHLAPMILNEFANTSSPGCLIAFARHHQDLAAGSLGILCSFGAGYSAGSVIVKKLA